MDVIIMDFLLCLEGGAFIMIIVINLNSFKNGAFIGCQKNFLTLLLEMFFYKKIDMNILIFIRIMVCPSVV